jgi:hypothetical protein
MIIMDTYQYILPHNKIFDRLQILSEASARKILSWLPMRYLRICTSIWEERSILRLSSHRMSVRRHHNICSVYVCMHAMRSNDTASSRTVSLRETAVKNAAGGK